MSMRLEDHVMFRNTNLKTTDILESVGHLHEVPYHKLSRIGYGLGRRWLAMRLRVTILPALTASASFGEGSPDPAGLSAGLKAFSTVFGGFLSASESIAATMRCSLSNASSSSALDEVRCHVASTSSERVQFLECILSRTALFADLQQNYMSTYHVMVISLAVRFT